MWAIPHHAFSKNYNVIKKIQLEEKAIIIYFRFEEVNYLAPSSNFLTHYTYELFLKEKNIFFIMNLKQFWTAC